MSTRKCCVRNCNKTRVECILHKFPNPDNNFDGFKAWVNSIGGDLLFLDNNMIYRQYRVCESHFENKFKSTSGRLTQNAVPTLLLSGIDTLERRPLQEINHTYSHDSANHRTLMDLPSTSKEMVSDPCQFFLSSLQTPAASKGAYMHGFPHPEKRSDMFNRWVSIVGNKLTETDPIKIYKNKKVCSHHFTFNQKVACHRLMCSAVPTLHLEGVFSSLSITQLEHNYCIQGIQASNVDQISYLEEHKTALTVTPMETKSSVDNENGDETNESVNTTSVTPHPEGDSDKNTASKLIDRRISCDTISDSVKSLGTCEDPLAIKSEEVADYTVSDFESYLEDIDEDISEWSDGIIDEYTQKWEPILKNGFVKGVQDEINSNYIFCKNLPSSKPPILNTEIANLLTEEIKTRDNELVNKQSQLGHALAALGKAMSGLRTNTMETSDILETLSDVGELIADLHYLETEARRSLIVRELDKSFAEPLKDRVRDEYLFGRDVGELVEPPEVKTTASSITPRMISTFLNKKKVQSPVAPPPVRQSTKNTPQKIMKRPATLTPVYQTTKKLRRSIETSLTTLRTCEEELSSDTGTAAPDPDPDPDSTSTDLTAVLTVSQLNNIQVDENCPQPLSPRRHSLTNDVGLMEGDLEDKDTGDGEICILLLDDASLTSSFTIGI